MAELTFRPVTPEDDPYLFSLFVTSREDLNALPLSPQEKHNLFLMQFRLQQQDYTRRYPHSRHVVLLLDGVPVGKLHTNLTNEELRGLEIIIAPEYRSYGIGTHVLKILMDEAQSAGVPFRHAVFKTNLRALSLYQRLGFEIVDEIPSHYLMAWLPETIAN